MLLKRKACLDCLHCYYFVFFYYHRLLLFNTVVNILYTNDNTYGRTLMILQARITFTFLQSITIIW